jgi:hypothetical protein
MMTVEEPEPDRYYVIEITYNDGTKAKCLGKFRGYEGERALWETPRDTERTGVAAEVEIVRQIPTDR